MSMKPGDRNHPAASMVRVAVADCRSPTAATRPSWMATSPRSQGLPDPSKIRAFLIRMSKVWFCSRRSALAPPPASTRTAASTSVWNLIGQNPTRCNLPAKAGSHDRLSRGFRLQAEVLDRLSRGFRFQAAVLDRLSRGFRFQAEVLDRLSRGFRLQAEVRYLRGMVRKKRS